MKVLSLFDGMSCGQIALDRLGINYTYYASEIDKYAIQITQKNYPNTIQLGDINGWKNWDIPTPDLIIGGSPCQGFSIAGKRLNFDDPRSKLFFVFADIVKHYNPKYFLLENVIMSDKENSIITNILGIESVKINSALVSAQNRDRLYWTNINQKKSLFDEHPLPGIEQPEDKKIYLKNILLDNIDERYYLSFKEILYMNKEVNDGRLHWDFLHHSDSENFKSQVVAANFYKGVPYNVLIDRRNNNCHRYECQFILDEECWCDDGDSYQETYNPIGSIRKFHPIECERLQTVPDNYTDGVSNTQRYKMLGNGWTVDVIAHILKSIK